jgi:3-oxo-5-alpha-steroid 4-dehydrogenase 1
MSGLLWAELVAAAIVFPLLLLVPAPYGRHHRAGWGPTLPARAGWILMELPAVVVPIVAFVHAGGSAAAGGVWLLALWQLHYLQRTFVFPLRMRPGARKPLLTVALALGFNLMNGWLNGSALAAWRADAWVAIGVAVFLAGFAINVHADAHLRTLRRPGETGYQIPRAGLFRKVSAANYFGELVEWLGFALAARTGAAWAFLVFTFANLVPRAVAHHRWYRSRFPDYPASRRAIIPWLL